MYTQFRSAQQLSFMKCTHNKDKFNKITDFVFITNFVFVSDLHPLSRQVKD